MEKREEKEFSWVLGVGSSIAMIVYMLTGFFGYAIFAQPDQIGDLCNKDILDAADLHNVNQIKVAKFAIILAVFATAPLCVLPAKDLIEQIVYEPAEMTCC